MDTLSDPFNFEEILAVAFIVWFKLTFDVFKLPSNILENGAKLAAGVTFTVFLVVLATQPAANINPTAISKENGTIVFIGGVII